ncbi:MAG: toll/interleukin-1 receptor domain-containing protein [Candidatus Acidiferrales bacterium]
MSFDVFISYASKDKIVADAVCARLEAAGIRCWIAPRDIVAGTSYGEAIIDAIHGAKVMVLVFSSSANASGHIPKEVERAVSSGVAILPFRIEDVAPGKSLDYFIGSVHWLDAMTPPMEKHLDDLAATVHKLIPAKGSEPTPGGASAASLDGTVMWQRGVPGSSAAAGAFGAGAAARTHAAAAAGSVAGSAVGGGLSKRKIWIGAAVAVVLLFALVLIFSRGGENSGRNSTPEPDTPAATNPAGDGNAASDPNAGGGKSVTPPAVKATPARRAAAGNANVDPLVGCYQWFNNSQVVIRADGTVTAGPFTARWRLVDAQKRAYTFTWPVMVETLTVSPDQRTMSGGNQYGYPISGGRMTGSMGLVGTWHWANGWNVDVAPNGTFTSGTFRGTWRAVDASRGLYEMNWPSPVDNVVLLGGGTRIAGSNQYGVATSGVKTGSCGGN